MARFDDTPQAKRDMRWDPVAQRLVKPDRPPSRKQIDFIRALAAKRGVEFVRPKTSREAQSMIDKLRGRGGRRRRSRSS